VRKEYGVIEDESRKTGRKYITRNFMNYIMCEIITSHLSPKPFQGDLLIPSSVHMNILCPRKNSYPPNSLKYCIVMQNATESKASCLVLIILIFISFYENRNQSYGTVTTTMLHCPHCV
jgi:hypothetical protein